MSFVHSYLRNVHWLLSTVVSFFWLWGRIAGYVVFISVGCFWMKHYSPHPGHVYYTATSWKSILHFFAIQQDGWSMNTYPVPKRDFPHKLCFWLLQESYILHSCATSKLVISGTVLPPQLSAHVHLLGFSLSFFLLF